MLRPLDYEPLVIGYHGCDRSVAEGVLPSKGIYFWEHGPDRALEWAVSQRHRGRVQKPAVLGAFIHLGRCLDLADTAATGRLHTWYDELKAASDAAGRPLPDNRQVDEADSDLVLRFLDCGSRS